jgi:hypothetical protein
MELKILSLKGHTRYTLPLFSEPIPCQVSSPVPGPILSRFHINLVPNPLPVLNMEAISDHIPNPDLTLYLVLVPTPDPVLAPSPAMNPVPN